MSGSTVEKYLSSAFNAPCSVIYWIRNISCHSWLCWPVDLLILVTLIISPPQLTPRLLTEQACILWPHLTFPFPPSQLIVLSTMAVGIVTTIVFHIFTKEPASPAPETQPGDQAVCVPTTPGGRPEPTTVGEWLKRTEFWMLSLIYMSVRLYVNLSMVSLTGGGGGKGRGGKGRKLRGIGKGVMVKGMVAVGDVACWKFQDYNVTLVLRCCDLATISWRIL